jgi:hypothetical protein
MQYFINYVLGWPSESNKRADIGTMAHKVMECLAGLKKFSQDNPKKNILTTTDDVLGKVKVSVREFRTDEYLKELSDLSFTNYSEKFHKHEWLKKDCDEIYKLVKIFVDHNDGQFDPRYRLILSPEQHFDLPIEEEWAKFEYEHDGKILTGQLAIKGTIDLMTTVNKDTIEVIDWKTGRRMNWATGEEKDFKKLSQDPQLMLYFYAITRLFPKYPNKIMTIFFCKNASGSYDPKPFSMCFDDSTAQQFLTMLKGRFEEIKTNKNPKLLDPRRNDFKCKKMCTYCKSNWPGTDQSMCAYVEKSIKLKGLEKTVSDCSRPGFNIGFYESPG